MRPARRRRTITTAIASIAVHVALVVALVLHAPRLKDVVEPAGPPQAVIPVLILPRAPPPVAGGAAQPAPIRLHRRQQPFAPEELPIQPFVAPVVEAPREAPAPGTPRAVVPPPPDPVAVNARQALRGSIGCANANALSLTREEREKCNERLAAGARDAQFPGLALDPDKAAELARTGARKEADYKYKRAPAPNGNCTTIGGCLANDRPELKVPF